MACENFTNLGASFANWEFIQGLVCVYAMPIGFEVFGLAIYGAIAGALWITQESSAIPIILTLLVGSAVLAQIIAPGMQFVTLMILGGATMAGLYLLLRVRNLGR